jgi:hypothetical protein
MREVSACEDVVSGGVSTNCKSYQEHCIVVISLNITQTLHEARNATSSSPSKSLVFRVL